MHKMCAISAGALLSALTIMSPAHAESSRADDPSRPVAARAAAPVSTGAASARSRVSRSARYASLIAKYAKSHGVPVDLAHAVVRVESNYNERARGSAGEIGLMQIKPATARAMGFSGSTKDLYDPAVNLKWGMSYLAGAYELAGGDTCGTILRYNGGHYAKRMNPISARYCRKVASILKSGEAS